MKARVITARVNDNTNNEIEFIKSTFRLPNTTSALTYAIHFLYGKIKEEESKKSSLERFIEKGLLGCLEGTSDLSTTYKKEISAHISTKHSQPLSSKKRAKR